MKQLVEIACASRHDGKGNMIEVFVISSNEASVTLTRKGAMRRKGIDTKLTDTRMDLNVNTGHYDLAMANAQKVIQEFDRRNDHSEQFGEDTYSDAYFLRYPKVADLSAPGVGESFQTAVLFLFNDAIWHGMMWSLFPDMKGDANFTGQTLAEIERKAQIYNTWGAW